MRECHKAKYHYRSLKDIGDCHAAAGDFKRAWSSYQQAAAAAPAEAGVHVSMGLLAFRQGQNLSARNCFEAALIIDPDNSEACGGLAVVRQQEQDYPGAFEMYMRCLELQNDNLVALLGLFQTSCQMGTFCQITRYLEIYLFKHPDDVSVLFCLATLHARDGRLEQARKAVLKVLSLESDKPEAADLLMQIESRLATV